MTAHDDLDRAVQAWFAADAPHAAPSRLLTSVVAETSRRRPRPAWLVVVRGDETGTLDPHVGRLGRPIIRLALAAMLVVGLIGWAVFGAGAPRSTSVAVPTATTTKAPSTIETPSATPISTPRRTFGPYGVTIEKGPLPPGRYSYLFIDDQGFSATFSVPDGWTWNGRSLSKGGADLPGGASIFFFGGRIQVYADPCLWATMPTGTHAGSAAAVVAALAAQPDRSATIPTDGSAMGLVTQWPAMEVELSVPAGLNFALCDHGQFRSWGPDGNARSNEGPGQHDLVWVIDVPGAGTGDASVPFPDGGLLIDAASFPGTPPAVVDEMRSILQSVYVGHFG